MIRLGFIGTGNVSSAILGGNVAAGLVSPDKIHCHDKDPERLLMAHAIAPFNTCRSNIEVLEKAEAVFLAVKPQNVPEVLEEVKGVVTHNHLIITVCAGIKTSYIERELGNQVRVVREEDCLSTCPYLGAQLQCGPGPCVVERFHDVVEDHRKGSEVTRKAAIPR